jgi:pimeloyl-ACP methyl ester carboxylesterase
MKYGSHCQIRDNLVNQTPPASKRVRFRHFLERNQRRATAAGIVCFLAGIILSHHLAPGVHVEKAVLSGDTPAVKFVPAGAGPHPVALLAHGYSGTKENLFWYASALSEAGFVCYSVDLPGHGESQQLFSPLNAAQAIGRVAHDLGTVDVLIGHSMGGIAGGEAVREGLLQPKLMIAVGADAHLGDHGSPLLLVGRFDEFFKPSELKARTDARTIVSPWSNHGFELFDPLLIHAAVNAASAAISQPAPHSSMVWFWNVVGVLLAMLGAFTLALTLPELPGRWAWAHGVLVAVIISGACFLTFHNWLDLKPHPKNIPWQIIAAIVAVPLLAGARKLRVRRGALGLLAIATGVAAVFATHTVFAQTNLPLFWIVRLSLVLAPSLLFGAVVGMVATIRGSQFSGDVAMALIVGVSLFQLGNAPQTVPSPVESPHFIKLDEKSYGAVVGQYQFPPDNVFRTGAQVKIWREGDRIFLQATGGRVLQGAHQIFPESETNFFLPINGAKLAFIKNDQGEVTGLIHHMTGLPDSEAKKVR